MVQGSRRERWKLGWAVGITLALLWGLACNNQIRPGNWTTIAHIPFLGDVVVHILLIQGIFIAVLGGLACVWMWRRMHPVTTQLSRIRQQPSLPLIGAAVGIVPLQHLFLLVDESPYAVCLGMWRPAVYVSTGLLTHLAPLEVRAVLAHEECHRRRHDPLRLLLWRGILAGSLQRQACATVMQRLEVRAEVRADRFARRLTSTATLAAALLHVLRASPHQQHERFSLSPPSIMGIDGAGNTDTLGERLRYLSLALTHPLPPPLLAQLWSQYRVGFVLPGLGLVGVPAVVLAVTNTVTLPHALWPVVSCALHL